MISFPPVFFSNYHYSNQCKYKKLEILNTNIWPTNCDYTAMLTILTHVLRGTNLSTQGGDRVPFKMFTHFARHVIFQDASYKHVNFNPVEDADEHFSAHCGNTVNAMRTEQTSDLISCKKMF